MKWNGKNSVEIRHEEQCRIAEARASWRIIKEKEGCIKPKTQIHKDMIAKFTSKDKP